MHNPTNAKGAVDTGTVTTKLGLPCVTCAYSTNARVFSFVNRVFPSSSSNSAKSTRLSRRERVLGDVNNVGCTGITGLVGLPSLSSVSCSPTNICRTLANIRGTTTASRSYVDLILSHIARGIHTLSGQRGGTRDNNRACACVRASFVGTLGGNCIVRVRRPSAVIRPNMLMKLGSLLRRANTVALPAKRIVRQRPSTIMIIAAGVACRNYHNVGRSIVSHVDLIQSIRLPAPRVVIRHTVSIAKRASRCRISRVIRIIDSLSRCYQGGDVASNSCKVHDLVS